MSFESKQQAQFDIINLYFLQRRNGKKERFVQAVMFIDRQLKLNASNRAEMNGRKTRMLGRTDIQPQ
jgi:hypothetical protein